MELGGDLQELTGVDGRNANLGQTGTTVAWSPDGAWIAYTSAVGDEIDPDRPLVHDRALFNADFGLADKQRLHLWIIPATGGRPKQLTSGDYDHHSIAWSPDSKSIVFVSNRTGKDDDNANNDLCAVSVPEGEFRQITNTPGPEYAPAFSPDGAWLAYLARTRATANKDSNPEDSHLYKIPVSGGQSENLSQSLDRRVDRFAWDPNGRGLFFTAQNEGGTEIHYVAHDGGAIRKVVGEAMTAQAIDVMSDGRLTYLRTTEADPGEVWMVAPDGSDSRKLTSFNEAFLAAVRPSKSESLWFESFDGKKIQAFLLKPRDFDPNERYPMVVAVHGGPHAQQGHRFRLYEQLFAANDYVVLMVNYRGSSGYGQAFADADYRDLLGGDYKDVMAGVDHALEAFSFIDPSRMGVTGVSYGGYMTNWVITQTNRFKSAIPVSSISNNVSLYGNSSIQLWLESELGAKYWEDWDIYWQTSPITEVYNVKTPTLFIHGEQDHICPLGQAEEMFLSLQKLGVPSVLAAYPDEGHGFPRRPDRRRDALQRAVDWMDFYLKGAAVSTTE
jgi:dipeptidyl aminopeptidase/acylaminoacyl peptidase